MKYNSVIFDWDGVLGMTLHFWLAGYRHELEKLGYNLSDKEIVFDFFYDHTNIMKKKYPNIEYRQFVDNVHDYMVENVPMLKTYPQTHEALEKLQNAGIKLTLVSSSPRRFLKRALEQLKLDGFFAAIVAGDDVMKHKPDPEAFLNVMEIGKLNPETTITIGDSEKDIRAAKATQIDSCLYLPEDNKLFRDFDELKATNPDYIVKTLPEFADLILNS